jgi:hypothetical protein
MQLLLSRLIRLNQHPSEIWIRQLREIHHRCTVSPRRRERVRTQPIIDALH